LLSGAGNRQEAPSFRFGFNVRLTTTEDTMNKSNFTIRTFPLVSMAVVASALALGCNSPDKAQERADEARQQAQDMAGAAQRAAADAQAEAVQKQAEATQTLATARNDYHAQIASLMVAVDKRTADLQAANLTATGADKQKNLDKIAALASYRRTLDADLHDVDTVTTANWDLTRARVDKDISDVKSALSPFSNKT
jgi:hypothetical protein